MAKLTYGAKPSPAHRREAALAGFLPGHAVVIAVVAGVAPVGADGGEQFQRPEFYGLDEADVAVEAVAVAEYVPGPADMEHARKARSGAVPSRPGRTRNGPQAFAAAGWRIRKPRKRCCRIRRRRKAPSRAG